MEQEELIRAIQEAAKRLVAPSDYLKRRWIDKGYILEPWASSQQITGFGTAPLATITTSFTLTDQDVILTDMFVDQWLTANATSTTMPTGVPLPNAGVFGDGANLKSGLGFKFSLKSDEGGSREFFNGWRPSSQLEGPLFNRLPLAYGLEQKKSTVSVLTQTLDDKGAGDTYEAYVTLVGLYPRKTKDC